jgi:hypothetical protein
LDGGAVVRLVAVAENLADDLAAAALLLIVAITWLTVALLLGIALLLRIIAISRLAGSGLRDLALLLRGGGSGEADHGRGGQDAFENNHSNFLILTRKTPVSSKVERLGVAIRCMN